MPPLHPNLARIAAEYDQIISTFQSGQIPGSQAAAKISALVAKDDAGVEWSIEPVSGMWQYRTLDGRFVQADPPSWGMAGATPQDLGARTKRDQDARITFHEVDEDRFAGSLHGSTRRPGHTDDAGKPNMLPVVVAAGVAVVAAALFFLI